MKLHEVLFSILREGLKIEKASVDYVNQLSSLNTDFWSELFKVATQHGVGALAYDGLTIWMLNPVFKKNFPKPILLQWGMSVFKVESDFANQSAISADIAEIFNKEGIKTIVLKGLSIAIYYPNPNHRPCCDLDCFLLGDYNRGNSVSLANGALVDKDNYKHSHVYYRGMLIENHQFLTNFNGTSLGRKVERKLQDLIRMQSEYSYYKNTHLIFPCREFIVLFLLKHSHTHFITEGLSLRQLVDWMLFLKNEQNKIDWGLVNSCIDEFKLRTFANLITAWCEKNLHLVLESNLSFGKFNPILLSRFEKDLFSPLLLTNGMKWWQKIPCIFYRYKRVWNFKEVLDEPIYFKLVNSLIYCSYFRKVPTL